jgi:Protein of unknown function (DUF2938)
MTELAELIVRAVLIGAGGAALMDVWGVAARRLFGIQGLDYTLLGRWIGHTARGHCFHKRIAAASPVRWESALGWAAHYSIGIAFAALLLLVWGLRWAHAPTVAPALAIGVGTILAPWLIMQPAMGAGIAGSRTLDPVATRVRNLATHTVYGVGLYVTALALAAVWP